MTFSNSEMRLRVASRDSRQDYDGNIKCCGTSAIRTSYIGVTLTSCVAALFSKVSSTETPDVFLKKAFLNPFSVNAVP